MHYSYSTQTFEKRYTYTKNDLGFLWTPAETRFRVWAPTAEAVCLRLYRSGTPWENDLVQEIPMVKSVHGTWTAAVSGNWEHYYYTYNVHVNNTWTEACDPYAKSTGVNGKRAMILDMASTNPCSWEQDCNPNAGLRFVDTVLYELHIRDFSIDSSSGIHHKGKFLGVIEEGTKTPSGHATGLDYMKQLGITHLHLLPFYDYGSVDESRLDIPQFNWGYDPVNYNVPEGSYSTNPYDGAVRVAELKQMIQGLHKNGISVVMDVVYNHVYHADEFCFNQIVPGYFSRSTTKGGLSNGSGCGNDTASERSMVRKYIVDSVLYWAEEYHIDGFRFDLVGLIDTDTIRELMDAVHAKHPHVIFYGEGWDIPTQVTKKNVSMTIQRNASMVPGFAFFNDTVRDLLRGSVFYMSDLGFVCGKTGCDMSLLNCFRGAPGWTNQPAQVVNYVSCHDNHTLIDRLAVALPHASPLELAKRSNLAAAFSLLCQGIPFFQAGEELLRSKPGPNGERIHNSYCSPDSVNAIKWNALEDSVTAQTVAYYKGLLAIRKRLPLFRMTDSERIASSVTPLPTHSAHAAAFQVTDGKNTVIAVFNANTDSLNFSLPDGNWSILAKGSTACVEPIGTASGSLSIPAISAAVLLKQ